MNAPAYLKARNDAGLLREYIVAHYGAALTHGATGGRVWQGLRLVRRLARLARLPIAEVLRDVRADYEIAFA